MDLLEYCNLYHYKNMWGDDVMKQYRVMMNGRKLSCVAKDQETARVIFKLKIAGYKNAVKSKN